MTRRKKNLFSILLAIAALFIVTLACGSESTPTKVGEVSEEEVTTEEIQEALSDTPQVVSQETYKVGDIVSIGDMVMVVLGWDTPSGDEFIQPEENHEFVVVDVMFVNQGDDANSISSLIQMKLKDDTGQQYDVDLSASMAAGDSSPEGEMSPGEKLRGKVGFQVPENVEGLEFVFDADVFGTGKVFVELGEEPVSVEPPASLVGEQEQTIYEIGDIIDIGDFSLTVNEANIVPGDEFVKPDEGKQFVVIDVTITNNTDESTGISSLLQMWLKDDTGQKFEVDLMASSAMDGTLPDGELAPGEKIRGQVGYQVPEDVSGLEFVFDADVFGYGKLFVAIPLE